MRLTTLTLLAALTLASAAASVSLAAPDPASSPRPALVFMPPRLAQDVLESAVLQELLRLRDTARIDRSALPVMVYTLDRPTEQEYCRFTLGIRLGQAPCIALVTVRTVQGQAVPDRVLDHVVQVRDWKGACTQIFQEWNRRRAPGCRLGILVVWDRAHAPTKGALESAARAARSEQMLQGLAARTSRVIRDATGATSTIRIVLGRDRADLYARWNLGPTQLPMAGVANVDERGELLDLRLRLENVERLPEDAAAHRLADAWGVVSRP